MNKLTKGTALATAVCGLLISATPAFAYHDDDQVWAYAKVVRAEPIYREVRVREPRQVCEDVPVVERTTYRGHSDPGAVLVGAVIGGVIGHQFGGGSGRDAADRTYSGRRVVEREVIETRCETVRAARYEERLEGYDVTYKYHGRLYHTRTAQHPGRTIKVRVSVTPAQWD